VPDRTLGASKPQTAAIKQKEPAMPYFQGSQGRIFHDSWLPDGDVRTAVVFLHGYAEHLGLYDALARRLVADGHAVHAMDAIGHGRSEGERGVIASWDYYVEDAHQLVSLARDQHPEVPVVVMGHSGGSATAYLLALRHSQLATALVLSAGPLRPLPWVYEMLAAGEAETDDLDPTALLSTHADYVHALLHDPLTYKGGFRRESLLAITQIWPEIAAGLAAGQPDLPVLLVHGEADPVVPLADSQYVAAALPNATLVTFPGDLHDVLNEHDCDTVHNTIAAFLLSASAARPTHLALAV
jgi:acylglycerol lipase